VPEKMQISQESNFDSHELSWSFLDVLSTIVKFCMSCTFKGAVFKEELLTFET